MASDVVVATRSTRRSASPRYRALLFCGWVLLLLGTVFLGFAKSYFLAGVFRAPLPSGVIQVHGAAFTSWILLLIVQTSLVSAGRIDLHRRLGMVGFGLACLMVVLGIIAATDFCVVTERLCVDQNLLRRNTGDYGHFRNANLLRVPGKHLSVGAQTVDFARDDTVVGGRPSIAGPSQFFSESSVILYVVAYSYLLLLVAYDLWSIRKVHRATIWEGPSWLSHSNSKYR